MPEATACRASSVDNVFVLEGVLELADVGVLDPDGEVGGCGC